jgi:hypothetical protein
MKKLLGGNPDKAKFRQRKCWKDFREHMKEVSENKDFITKSKLYKTWNLHHLDPEHYELLEDDRFVALNSMTHDFVEWFYKYYRKDPDVLERIKNVMERMKAFELQPDL